MTDDPTKPLLCKDHDDDRPGCLKIADPRYTMDFTDVEGGGYIYWCSSCGKWAHEMNKRITHAMENRPGFVEKFRKAIKEVEPS